ncbi:UDP-glucose/GDP-mannose dehydrogenase family protein [Phytohabitans flavus]|uniref:UDP-glucose 6-dehydrogenase n=1 Tax=Phytohabitans flavus TaxID=1076124 RepID=A0A6F8Y4J0_9ACTN|nr:UDP-glucose/GDP-mannose dehydrogenase family protein [Phytohabitans flavus]BCB80898.1 UDP-glucose 6-dehydrogenase [Phytohabitans flavus]
MNITVIGTGRLGAPYAAGMASLGHHVLGVDANPDTVAALQTGKAPFAEPGLAEAITNGAATGHLTFTGSYAEAARHATVHFIAVPTPQRTGSNHHDLSDVYAAADTLAGVIDKNSLIVVKSSVPAGTCDQIATRIAQRAPSGVRIEVAASPDFMREGCSIADVRRPSRIVLGVQPGGAAEPILRDLWAPCLADGVPLVVTDLKTAELCKLAANAFLATRISFVNALAMFSDAAGANIDDLAEVIGRDTRIGRHYLAPGLGFGGSCLSKDIRGFVALATDLGVGHSLEFLTAVDDINQARRGQAVDLAVKALGGDPDGQPIAVWGAAFKPGIDDIRDSPALDVAACLHEAGAHVTVYDPLAISHARVEHPELTYATDAVAAVDGARVLLHLTAWSEFAAIDPATLTPGPIPTLVDARPGLDRDLWRAAGWTVSVL